MLGGSVLFANIVEALNGARAPGASNPFATSALLSAWRNRIVCIGDSIMAGVGSCMAAPADWLKWQIGEGAYVINKGIGGNRLADVSARMDADVIAYHPGICVLEVGTNDLGGLDSLVLGPMKTITATLLAAGIIPVWCTLLPRSDLPQHLPQIRRINTWLMAHAAAYGLPIADTYTEFAQSDGTPKTGYLQDGLHPSTTGGKAFADVVCNVLPDTARRIVPWRMLGDAENLIANPTFVVDSNADGVPDGWFAFANGVGTFSLEAQPSEGNWFTITKAVSGSAQQTGAVYTLAVTAGHTYRVALDFDYNESSVTNGFNSYITLSPSATNSFIMLNPQLQLSNSRLWHEFTVPDGDTTAYIYVWTGTTLNSAVLKVGRIRCWDVTTALE